MSMKTMKKCILFAGAAAALTGVAATLYFYKKVRKKRISASPNDEDESDLDPSSTPKKDRSSSKRKSCRRRRKSQSGGDIVFAEDLAVPDSKASSDDQLAKSSRSLSSKDDKVTKSKTSNVAASSSALHLITDSFTDANKNVSILNSKSRSPSKKFNPFRKAKSALESVLEHGVEILPFAKCKPKSLLKSEEKANIKLAKNTQPSAVTKVQKTKPILVSKYVQTTKVSLKSKPAQEKKSILNLKPGVGSKPVKNGDHSKSAKPAVKSDHGVEILPFARCTPKPFLLETIENYPRRPKQAPRMDEAPKFKSAVDPNLPSELWPFYGCIPVKKLKRSRTNNSKVNRKFKPTLSSIREQETAQVVKPKKAQQTKPFSNSKSVYTVDTNLAVELLPFYGCVPVPLYEATESTKSVHRFNSIVNTKPAKKYSPDVNSKPDNENKQNMSFKSMKKSAPVAESKPDMKNKPNANSKLGQKVAPVAESKPDIENKGSLNSKPAKKVAPVAESKPDKKNKPNANSKLGQKVAPVAESKPDMENKGNLYSKPLKKVAPVAESKPDKKNKPNANSKLGQKVAPVAESKPDMENKENLNSKPLKKVAPVAESKSDKKNKPNANSKLGQKVAPVAESKPDMENKGNLNSKSEQKGTPSVESKPVKKNKGHLNYKQAKKVAPVVESKPDMENKPFVNSKAKRNMVFTFDPKLVSELEPFVGSMPILKLKLTTKTKSYQELKCTSNSMSTQKLKSNAVLNKPSSELLPFVGCIPILKPEDTGNAELAMKSNATLNSKPDEDTKQDVHLISIQNTEHAKQILNISSAQKIKPTLNCTEKDKNESVANSKPIQTYNFICTSDQDQNRKSTSDFDFLQETKLDMQSKSARRINSTLTSSSSQNTEANLDSNAAHEISLKSNADSNAAKEVKVALNSKDSQKIVSFISCIPDVPYVTSSNKFVEESMSVGDSSLAKEPDLVGDFSHAPQLHIVTDPLSVQKSKHIGDFIHAEESKDAENFTAVEESKATVKDKLAKELKSSPDCKQILDIQVSLVSSPSQSQISVLNNELSLQTEAALLNGTKLLPSTSSTYPNKSEIEPIIKFTEKATEAKLPKCRNLANMSKSDIQINIMKKRKVSNLEDIKNELKASAKMFQYQSKNINKNNGRANLEGKIDPNNDGAFDQSDDECDSDDSYISAVDAFDIKPHPPKRVRMYDEAMKFVTSGDISCRKIRTELAFVRSKEDFLAKVHCLRQGFEVMFENKHVLNWVAFTFQSIMVEILNMDEYEPFQSAMFRPLYDETIDFFLEKRNRNSVLKDLRLIGISHPTFYDIVLCYFIMDTLNDIDNSRNIFSHFEKTLEFPEGSKQFKPEVLARKIRREFLKKRVVGHTSFLAHMYRLCSYATPSIAIGLKGTKNTRMKMGALSFKEEAMDYIECLFSFDYVRYTKPAQMADDLWSLTKERASCLERHLRTLGKSKKIDDAKKEEHESGKLMKTLSTIKCKLSQYLLRHLVA